MTLRKYYHRAIINPSCTADIDCDLAINLPQYMSMKMSLFVHTSDNVINMLRYTSRMFERDVRSIFGEIDGIKL